VTRISWKAALLCAVASIVAAAAAYLIGNRLHRVYQSTGTIRVAVPTQGGIDDPNVLAANDLSTQDAQLVGSDPVKTLAANSLGVSPGSLDGKLSGSTVGAQNLIQVTASGTSRAQSQARAKAGVYAVQRYLSRLTDQQNAQYLSSLRNGVNSTPLTSSGGSSLGAADKRQVAVANATQRAQLIAQGIHDATGNRPSFQVVDAGTSAGQTSPKPKLYALVALIVALIITGRLAFMFSRRRQTYDRTNHFVPERERELSDGELVGAGRS
jgi:capsular polysaccharide biosynthesis protein